jgi:hypothetical protein
LPSYDALVAILERQEDLLVNEKKKNAALTRKYKEIKASYNILEKSFDELKLSHESLTLENIKRMDDHETLKVTHDILKAKHLDLIDEQSKLPQVGVDTPCPKCINLSKDTPTLAHDNVASITNPIPCEATILSENARLKGLLQNGLLKCYKSSKALKEILSHQMENFNHEGLGFTPRFNENGKAWTPRQYPKTKFVQAKEKQCQTSMFEGHVAKRGLPNLVGTFDASYVIRKGKDGKAFAKYVGPRNGNHVRKSAGGRVCN